MRRQLAAFADRDQSQVLQGQLYRESMEGQNGKTLIHAVAAKVVLANVPALVNTTLEKAGLDTVEHNARDRREEKDHQDGHSFAESQPEGTHGDEYSAPIRDRGTRQAQGDGEGQADHPEREPASEILDDRTMLDAAV
jgi:hypothetical protein